MPLSSLRRLTGRTSCALTALAACLPLAVNCTASASGSSSSSASAASRSSSASSVSLAARVTPILRSSGLNVPGVGIAVIDLASGKLVYARSAQTQVVPASNEKLFTTAAALRLLGPGFRYQTQLVGVGTQHGSVFDGNLYLLGAGDPTLTSSAVRSLASALTHSGITHVSGAVIGDASVFDAERFGPQWKPEFDFNESPPLSGLAVDRDGFSQNPALVAAQVLRSGLSALGITTSGARAGLMPAYGTRRVLARHASATLTQIIAFMDQNSDNFTAEMMLKTIGARIAGDGSSFTGALVEQQAISDLIGGAADRLELVDGSGLSSANRVTALGVAQLLAASASDPQIAAPIFNGLSVAGVSGTLRHRLIGTPLAGRVHAKSGTLNGVSAESGYAPCPDGHQFAFAIIANAPTLVDWRAHVAQDALVQLFASCPWQTS